MDPSPATLTSIQFAVVPRGYSRPQVDAFLNDLSGRVGYLQAQLADATRKADAAEQELGAMAEANPAIGVLLERARAATAAVDPGGAFADDQWSAAPFAGVEFFEVRKGYNPGEVRYFLDELGQKLTELQRLVRVAEKRADTADAHLLGAYAAGEAAQVILAEARTEAAAIIAQAKADAQVLTSADPT